MINKPALLLALLVGMAASTAQAAPTWNGSVDGNWTTAGNWTSGPPTTSFIFNAVTPNQTISLNGASIFGTFTFQAGAGAYTFNEGGGTLIGAVNVESGVTASQIFNASVGVTATFNYVNDSTSAVVNFAGGMNNTTVGAKTAIYKGVGSFIVNGLTGPLIVDKRGTGTLTLTGVSTNTGAPGSINVRNGTLLINSGTALGSNVLVMDGGIVGLGSGDFTRTIGAGANQFRWTDSASSETEATGFAAYGADRAVNLGETLNWGATSHIFVTQQLVLGSADSTHKLNFQNGINLANGTRTIIVNNGTSSTNVDGEISGVISSTTAASGALIKTGLGTLLLSNANTYEGLTTVSQGVVLISGSLAGGATVEAGAALGGPGMIAGAVTISGSLRPGSSIGTLTVQNDVIWNGGDAWDFELGTAAASLAEADLGASFQDQLSLTDGGDFLKGSGTSWVFDFNGTGGVGWYKIVDWSGTTSFVSADFTATNLAPGLLGFFAVDESTSALYFNVTPVPEPNAVGLVAFAAFVSIISVRRRSRQGIL